MEIVPSSAYRKSGLFLLAVLLAQVIGPGSAGAGTTGCREGKHLRLRPDGGRACGLIPPVGEIRWWTPPERG